MYLLSPIPDCNALIYSVVHSGQSAYIATPTPKWTLRYYRAGTRVPVPALSA